MTLSPYAAQTLRFEAISLRTRLDRLQPFALVTPQVAAAAASVRASTAIERHLHTRRREMRARVRKFLRYLQSPEGRGSTNAEAQRRFAFLKLRFNAVLTQLDIFADALVLRCEQGNGVWLAGLDAAAEDALVLTDRFFDPPPVVTYLDRGHGAAIRRARTRLPGGGENPVAIIRVPRERMVGSGIASSLVHEVGHQGAALLGLVDSLRSELTRRAARSRGREQLAWQLYARWISEIVADFWAVAKVGIAATQGLFGVVSLPRAFVFRIQLDDPHPFPWIRVKLSAAFGQHLYPEPQWRLLTALWESLYPHAGLDPRRLALLAALEATLPEFVELVTDHRPEALGGAALAEVFPLAERRPERLRALFDLWRRDPSARRTATPTLAFAVIGQARQDQRLSPEAESRMVAGLLEAWALERALRSPDAQA